VTTIRRKPLLSIWIRGTPKSLQAGTHRDYTARIRASAAKQIQRPLNTNRIDIDVIFSAKVGTVRADVDNVAKPILDALKGVVYKDDKQVRSIRVAALPQGEAVSLRGNFGVHLRLQKGEEFLINIYEGRYLDVPIVERQN